MIKGEHLRESYLVTLHEMNVLSHDYAKCRKFDILHSRSSIGYMLGFEVDLGLWPSYRTLREAVRGGGGGSGGARVRLPGRMIDSRGLNV